MGRRARLDHGYSTVVPPWFFLHLTVSDITTLCLPTRIVHDVAKQLKITPHALVSVPLRTSKFYEFGIQME
jgi:hypothetical protein